MNNDFKEFKEAQASMERLKGKLEDLVKLIEQRRKMNRLRNWTCMGVGWLTGTLIYFVVGGTHWWGVVIAGGAAFGSTLIAQRISRL